MYVPSARERVRLAGRRELFFVLAVDLEHCCADVIPLDGMAYVEHGLPFASIELYEERTTGSDVGDLTRTR